MTEGSKNNETMIAEINGIEMGRIKMINRTIMMRMDVHSKIFLLISFDKNDIHSILINFRIKYGKKTQSINSVQEDLKGQMLLLLLLHQPISFGIALQDDQDRIHHHRTLRHVDNNVCQALVSLIE